MYNPGLLCGIVAFFNAVQLMVVVKYPDVAVDDTATTDYSWTSPYGWVDFSLFYLMYLPLIAAVLLVSMGKCIRFTRLALEASCPVSSCFHRKIDAGLGLDHLAV